MNSSIKFLNFSPNSSKVNTPLAESTAIGSPLTRQYQPQKRKSISPLSSAIHKQRSLRIDPHVLTDAQSNGIVSRLVKYYDQSNESDKSKLVYNKFGDFPLVHLKKTEIKRPLVRTSSVRIAPPSKAVMNPNLRAAIMRRNSFQLSTGIPKIVPTKMRAKDDSHKIITNHEPITDTNYPVSSKSVLDALEKNCRKRINNEELTLDRNKKFCAPLVSEVDSPVLREFVPIVSAPPVNQQSAKRNREEDISPLKSSSSSVSLSNQQSKRLKIRNNALLSSLSSSHYELPALNTTLQKNSSTKLPSTPIIVPVTNKTPPKQLRDQIVQTVEEKSSPVKVSDSKNDGLRAKEVEQPMKKLHLFNVKPVPNAAMNRAKLRSLDDDEDDEFKISFVKPKEKVLENYDVMSYVEKDKLDRMLKGLSQGIKSPIKEVQKDAVDSTDKTKQVVSGEKSSAASISFTTSTTISTIAPISTPASTSSTTISLNPSSTTNVSDKTTTTDSTSNPLLPKPSFGGFQIGSSNESQKTIPSIVTSTAPGATTKQTLGIIAPASSLGSSKPVSPLALFSTPKVDDKSSTDLNKPLISFTPLKPAEPTVSSTQSILVAPAKPSFSFGSNNSAPEKKSVGFSFGTSSASTSAATLPTASVPSFSFGSNIGKLPSTTASSTNALGQPTVSFQSPVTSATTAPSSFSFGSNTSTKILAPVSNAQAPIFGITSSTPGSSAPSFTKPETTQSSGIGFSFGSTSSAPKQGGFSFGSTEPAKPQTSALAVPSTSVPAFAFGSQSKMTTSTAPTAIFPSVQTTTTAPPAFSFGGSNTNTTVGSGSGGFSGFGSVQKTETNTAGIFSFGQKPQTAPVTTVNSSFSFGSSLPQASTTALSAQPTQTAGFSFGGSSAPKLTTDSNKPAGIFGRLGEKQPDNKPFSFGGNNTTSNNLQGTLSVPTFGGNSMGIASSTTSVPPVFGSTTNSSVFGQSPALGANTGANLFSNANNTANNNQTSSPFGASSAQPTQPGNNLFAFNSSSTNNNQPQTGVFGFGGNPSRNNISNNNSLQQNAVSPPTNSIFGSNSNNNNSGQNVSASFTFKPASATVSNTPSSFGQSSAPPYQFGSGNNTNNISTTNVSASFTFSGGSTSAPASAQSAPSSAPIFNFGNATPSIGSGAFNFQGQQTAAPQPSPGSNLFNIGTGGTQQRRPTRVATRRYK